MAGRPLDLDGDPGPAIDPAGQRVLIAYLFPALGDALLLAPAVKALLARGATVDLLLRESAARIWAYLDLDVGIHVVAEDELETARPLPRYDIAIDLTRRFDADGRQWIRDTAPIRLGWMGDEENNPPDGLTFGTVDFRVASERHWSRYQILPMRCLGVTEPDFDLPWKVDPDSNAAAAKMFGDGPKLVIVPGSRQQRKMFKPQSYGHAAARIGKSSVFVGAPNERAMLEEVARIGGGRVYAERDLGQLIALIQQADAVLTNDTGPMHIAFLNQVPTVAVFSQMPPLVWGPPRPTGNTIVIRVDPASDDYSVEECGEALANAMAHLLAP